MAPIVHRLADRDGVEARVCVTAQHRSMLDDVLRIFGITPDYDLDIMTPGQTLSGITSAVLQSLDPFEGLSPRLGSGAGRHHHRDGGGAGRLLPEDPGRRMSKRGFAPAISSNPWPEEVNRRIATVASTRRYCPTESGRGRTCSARASTRAASS